MRLRVVTVLSSLVAVVVPATAAAGAPGPSIRLARPLPGVVRIGDTATIAGRLVPAPPARSAIMLQGLRSPPWVTLVRARPTRGGRFVLRWHVRPGTLTGPLQLRVVWRAGGRVVVATHPVTAGVGPRFVRCAAPVPPTVDIPAGDGWIVGGLYDEGGPFPGIDQCSSSAYTIVATASDGIVAATQTVPGAHSYTLVVPAGSYGLSANPGCRGQATVTAGEQTVANTICAFP